MEVEEIFLMEKLTHKLRMQETQFEDKWRKWTYYRTQEEDTTIITGQYGY